MAFAPFPAFEGIRQTKDPQGIETISAAYYVATLAEARFWVPEFSAQLAPLVMRRSEAEQEWSNAALMRLNADGAFKVRFFWEGMANPRDGEMGIEFDGDGKVNSEPLGSHPDLQFIIDKYGGEVDPQTRKLSFPDTLESGGKASLSGDGYVAGDGLSVFSDGASYAGTGAGAWRTDLNAAGYGGGGSIKNPMFDVKKYWAAALTWKCTYATLRPSPSVTRRVGKIDQPRSAPDGYLPEIPDSHAWLKVIGNPQRKGNVYRVTEGWMALSINPVRDLYR